MSKTKEEYKQALEVVAKYERELKEAAANCWEFNINDKVLVKLKEEGFKYWLRDHECMPPDLRPTIEELKSKANKEGYVEFQMWRFSQLFGKTITTGGSLMFETTVRFLKTTMQPIKES